MTNHVNKKHISEGSQGRLNLNYTNETVLTGPTF